MLKLYDTLTRGEKEVVAEDGERLRFYCCGPTVYGPAHIGNFRTFLIQDLFRRVAELGGLKTLHVRNLTDVDDKTIRSSQEAGKTLREFTDYWTGKFHADCEALRMLPPHEEPSAVAHFPEQIALIEKLMEKGNAYQAKDGSVYFSVSSFENYGRLSHLDKRELKMGASERANDADEYDKDSLADFALWKAVRDGDGENTWASPWGRGRPGWHLECSAMGMKYLGETFDLHGGGEDLCFPHHENEIAQSEAATGKPFVRHWFHAHHLTVDGAKMSKSLGNLYTLEDLQGKGFTADEVRYTLLAGHYRQKLNFTLETVSGTRKALSKIGAFAEKLTEVAGVEELPSFEGLVARAPVEAGPFAGSWEALESDLNTADALGRLFTGMKEVERGLGEMTPGEAGKALEGFALIVRACGWELPAAGAGESVEAPGEIRSLADRRWKAKQAKDWAESDRLRGEIEGMGWVVKDGADGWELTPR